LPLEITGYAVEVVKASGMVSATMKTAAMATVIAGPSPDLSPVGC
jgi:hypothetical protein